MYHNQNILAKHAVIYIRVSTERQGEKASPSEQEKDCIELAKRLDLTIVGIYKDIEKYRVGKRMVEPSGVRSDRPGLQQMISDAQSGKFDTIIAWKEDRLYRGVNKALLDVSNLVAQNNINIFLVKENYDNKIAVVKAWAAQMELEAKSDRTAMGIKARLSQGKAWNLPNRLYGYKYNSDLERYIVVEDEAEWVNKIWEWFANGVSTNEIRQRLVAGNATPGDSNSRRKYLWANRRILKLLDYECYYTGIQKIEWNNEVYEIIFPVILTDRKIIEKVRGRKSAYKAYPQGATKYPTLTQGLVYCHADDVRLVMAGLRGGYAKRDGTKVRYAYYRCQNNKNRHAAIGCCKNIKAAKLDREVWNRIWELISNEGGLKQAIENRVKELEKTKYSADIDKENIENQLMELFEERQEVISLRRKKLISEDDLEIQLKTLTLMETSLKHELNEVLLIADHRIENLLELSASFTRQVRLGLDSINRPPRNKEEEQFQFNIKQKITKSFVRRIDVFEDHTFTVLTEINLENNKLFFIDQEGMSLMNMFCSQKNFVSPSSSICSASSFNNVPQSSNQKDNRYIIQLII